MVACPTAWRLNYSLDIRHSNGEPMALLPSDLPDGRQLIERGLALGRGLTLGRSLLCKAHGVDSEVEYKRAMLQGGRVTAAMNIGMQTWSQTARALESIHRDCEERGFSIDRYQMNLDRRMGLPRQFWSRAAKETGPMLESRDDWLQVGQVVPIQPHLGDMMIGSPASVSNACNALEAGVNYIGNLSQFHWKYPGWPGTDAEQVAETVTALGVMACAAPSGAMVHSYLDDGFSAQFEDFSSYLGWARFERYVVDELIGAKLSVSYGGLSHHPMTKAAMILALESATPSGNMNAFYHGNTTAYSRELDENFGVFSIDALYMTLAKLRAGGGAAILAVPVTEPVRIPSWREIVQIQTVARRVIDDAPRLMDAIDWPSLGDISEKLLDGGEKFFDNLLQLLEDHEVDLDDPLHILLAVRRLGARAIEDRCGAGESAREPVVASDTYRDFLAERDRIRDALAEAPEGFLTLDSRSSIKVVVASADVHEYALNLLLDAVSELGVQPFSAGTSVDPDALAQAVTDWQADVVLISTHNGMALTYAEQLLSELRHRGTAPRIIMGGVLNQDDGENEEPVDVSPALLALGIQICASIPDIKPLLCAAADFQGSD